MFLKKKKTPKPVSRFDLISYVVVVVAMIIMVFLVK